MGTERVKPKRANSDIPYSVLKEMSRDLLAVAVTCASESEALLFRVTSPKCKREQESTAVKALATWAARYMWVQDYGEQARYQCSTVRPTQCGTKSTCKWRRISHPMLAMLLGHDQSTFSVALKGMEAKT